MSSDQGDADADDVDEGGLFPQEPPSARHRAHVTFIDGAPGSGKTHRLRQYATHERDAYRTTLADSVFLTFTNAATNKSRERVHAEVYPDADEDAIDSQVRTIHSFALRACQREGLVELADDPAAPDVDEEVLIMRGDPGNEQDREVFADYYGRFFAENAAACKLDYDHDADDPMHGVTDDTDTAGLPAGNQVLALADYCASQRWSYSRCSEAPLFDEIDVSYRLAREVLDEWADYKRANGLIEHHDYVERALSARALPVCEVVYVDEFQDLSPLEYDYYAAIRDYAAERAYIAGDPLQSIYGFRGGTPDLLRETETDRYDPQDESWRCRQRILDAAAQVVRGPPEHGHPTVTARRTDDDGHAAHIDLSGPSELGDGVQATLRHPDHGNADHPAVFLLARTNQQAGRVASGLRQAGVPYHGVRDPGDYYGWADPLPMLLEAFRALLDGRPWPVPVAAGVLDALADDPAREAAQDAAAADQLGTLVEHDLFRGFMPEQYQAWLPELDRIDGGRDRANPDAGITFRAAKTVIRSLAIHDTRRDLLSRALDSGADHDPADVRVGTIHAAKGLEADCAFIFPKYSRAQRDRYDADAATAAEERRVFYVGLTRAARTAYVVHDYFGGVEFPPLDPDAIDAAHPPLRVEGADDANGTGTETGTAGR